MYRSPQRLGRLQCDHRRGDVPGAGVALAVQDFDRKSRSLEEDDKRCLRQRAPNSPEPVLQGGPIAVGHRFGQNDLCGDEPPAGPEHAPHLAHGPRLLGRGHCQLKADHGVRWCAEAC